MKSPARNRVVINTGGHQRHRPTSYRGPAPRRREGVVAISVIAAAALGTFAALFITSRPYDPMTSTFEAQQTIPQGPLSLASPSPKPSVSPTATGTPGPAASEAPAGGESNQPPPDDATIQAQIERALSGDSALSQLDVSTIVEGGHVTIVGSVRSAELKQRVERVVRSVKGVAAIDNQLVILEPPA
jgi:BON domain-containing protein